MIFKVVIYKSKQNKEILEMSKVFEAATIDNLYTMISLLLSREYAVLSYLELKEVAARRGISSKVYGRERKISALLEQDMISLDLNTKEDYWNKYQELKGAA